VSLSPPDADDAGFAGDIRPGQGKRMRTRCVRSSPEAWSVLRVETIFDSLNAKAALVAIREVFDEDGLAQSNKSYP